MLRAILIGGIDMKEHETCDSCGQALPRDQLKVTVKPRDGLRTKR